MILHNPFAGIKHLRDHVKLDLPVSLEGSEFVDSSTPPSVTPPAPTWLLPIICKDN